MPFLEEESALCWVCDELMNAAEIAELCAVYSDETSSPVLVPGTVIPPWEVHQHKDGYVYYFNQVTQESTWQPPPELLALAVPAPVDEYGWTAEQHAWAAVYGYPASTYAHGYRPAAGAAASSQAHGGLAASPWGLGGSWNEPAQRGVKAGMPDCTYYIKDGKCMYSTLNLPCLILGLGCRPSFCRMGLGAGCRAYGLRVMGWLRVTGYKFLFPDYGPRVTGWGRGFGFRV